MMTVPDARHFIDAAAQRIPDSAEQRSLAVADFESRVEAVKWFQAVIRRALQRRVHAAGHVVLSGTWWRVTVKVPADELTRAVRHRAFILDLAARRLIAA